MEIGTLREGVKVWEQILDENTIECHFMSPKGNKDYDFEDSAPMTVTFDLSEVGSGLQVGNFVQAKFVAYGLKQLYKKDCLNHRAETGETELTIRVLATDSPFVHEGKAKTALKDMTPEQLQAKIDKLQALMQAKQNGG